MLGLMLRKNGEEKRRVNKRIFSFSTFFLKRYIWSKLKPCKLAVGGAICTCGCVCSPPVPSHLLMAELSSKKNRQPNSQTLTVLVNSLWESE